MALLKQHYIIEGEYLGTGLRKDYSTVGTNLEVYSYAFFCNNCGRIWASCPIERPHRPPKWQILNMPCKADTMFQLWGGSIWLGADKEFVEAFTPAVISKEFFWLLEKFERTGGLE